MADGPVHVLDLAPVALRVPAVTLHLLTSAGYNGDDRVRCLCGTWSCEPTGPDESPSALGQFLDHVAAADMADRDTPPM